MTGMLVLLGVGNWVPYRCMVIIRSFMKSCRLVQTLFRGTRTWTDLPQTYIGLVISFWNTTLIAQWTPQGKATNADTLLPLCQYNWASVYHDRNIKRPIWPAECPRWTPWTVNSIAQAKTFIQSDRKVTQSTLKYLLMVAIQNNSIG
jgi:hypothetical protein